MLETWVHRVILQKYQSLQNKHTTTFYKKKRVIVRQVKRCLPRLFCTLQHTIINVTVSVKNFTHPLTHKNHHRKSAQTEITEIN